MGYGWILPPSESEATVPNRLFGPVDRRGESAKAGRFEDDDAAARNIRVYPSYVVNIGRIRRDVNPGPNAVFPERSGKFGRAIPHQGREAVGDGESRPARLSVAARVRSPAFHSRIRGS